MVQSLASLAQGLDQLVEGKSLVQHHHRLRADHLSSEVFFIRVFIGKHPSRHKGLACRTWAMIRLGFRLCRCQIRFTKSASPPVLPIYALSKARHALPCTHRQSFSRNGLSVRLWFLAQIPLRWGSPSASVCKGRTWACSLFAFHMPYLHSTHLWPPATPHFLSRLCVCPHFAAPARCNFHRIRDQAVAFLP